MSESNDIEIVFPQPPQKYGLQKATKLKNVEEFVTTVNEITQWFKDMNVEQIELWINFGAKSDGITKLFVSFEGQAGCKLTLKPKKINIS